MKIVDLLERVFKMYSFDDRENLRHNNKTFCKLFGGAVHIVAMVVVAGLSINTPSVFH